jgi:hypothetical protein
MLRISTGLATYILGGGSLKTFLEGAVLYTYSTAQPATADMDHPEAEIVNIFTLSSGAYTPEVLATGTVYKTSFADPVSMSSITVGGYEILGASVSSIAECVAQINHYSRDFTASNVADETCYITAKPGSGSTYNGVTVACTGSNTTTTNMTGGVDAVNGLTFATPSLGQMQKTGTWSQLAGNDAYGNPMTNKVPLSFRIVRKATDAINASVYATRIDGAIPDDLTQTPSTTTTGVTQEVDDFIVIEPNNSW